MAVRFAASASRHGISHERSRHVVSHCACPLYGFDAADADVVAFLGPDANGIPLEAFGIELESDDILVIHAMRLRGRYRADYARVTECQNG